MGEILSKQLIIEEDNKKDEIKKLNKINDTQKNFISSHVTGGVFYYSPNLNQ